jgi:CubicO group peptidase (beta-lactamase class C family)
MAVNAPAGIDDPKRTSMIRIFARRPDPRRLPKAREIGHARPQARWRARPAVEALDQRVLMSAGDPTSLSDRVAGALQPFLAQDQFPGISVAVVTGGQVALAQGYGLANVSTGRRVGPDTRFDIGSVTKTFTALGVLLLYQESKGTTQPLDLNAPISNYLHNTRSFKLPGKWSQVTTMELLNMTSGIPDVGGSRPWQAQLRSVAERPLLYAPGTQSSYSNANFDLLGELIEQRTGLKYGTFIQNQILGPLGMLQTRELGKSPTVPAQSVGYDTRRRGKWRKAKVQNGPAMYAAAGMVSTAQDMATYMMALLSERILDPATYELMWGSQPAPQYQGSNPPDTVLGMGWDTVIRTSAGVAEVAKNGQVPGYSSELILYPAVHDGVFVSFNFKSSGSRQSDGASAPRVADAVYDAIQDGSPTDERLRRSA